MNTTPAKLESAVEFVCGRLLEQKARLSKWLETAAAWRSIRLALWFAAVSVLSFLIGGIIVGR